MSEKLKKFTVIWESINGKVSELAGVEAKSKVEAMEKARKQIAKRNISIREVREEA